jgi:4-hydroxy-tetrahydrodipicolinate synthase
MFRGTGTAMLTPFNEDLSIDYKSLKSFTRFQVESGVDFLVVLGTTGEASTIDDDEKRKIIAAVIEEVNGKIPVVVGTGTNNTTKVVKLNKMAEELKADAVLIVNPYYNKGTQASLVEHYKYISERTPLPIIIYNVPSRTAMNILPDTILDIHDSCKNVAAVKEASGDISQIAKLIAAKPDTLTVLSGNDDQTLPIMALGGKGVISVFSNVYPKEMSELSSALLNGDMEKARQLHNSFLTMMNIFFIEASPMPLKYIAAEKGLCKNVLRLPLQPVSKKSEEILKKEMMRMEKIFS